VRAVTAEAIGARFEAGIEAARDQWSLLVGHSRSLDTVNHVLRLILQLGLLASYVEEFDALAAAQHEDGGWPDETGGPRSGVRNTCFAARNLIRLNRVLHRPDLADAVLAAVQFVIAQQAAAGNWSDPVWGIRDPTSSSMGLLLYARRESFGALTGEVHEAGAQCLDRAARYLERTQEPDGSWADARAYEAPIGPTGHLLPKLALYEGRGTPAVAAAVDYLIAAQDDAGCWDGGDVDHTCDATRALLLVGSVVDDPRIGDVTRRGVEWLRTSVNPDGLWGDRPGDASSLLITCDVLDCFSKYEASRRAVSMRTFWE
jgi:hypothetical protein